MTDRALYAGPVVRFSDTEKINPFHVLIELHDLALSGGPGRWRAPAIVSSWPHRRSAC